MPSCLLPCSRREKLHQMGDAVDASPVVQQRLSLVMSTMAVLHGAETADALISDAITLARQVRHRAWLSTQLMMKGMVSGLCGIAVLGTQ